MEQILGRPLRPDETIHHINGDPLDNDPANLLLLDKRTHTRLHARANYPEKRDALLRGSRKRWAKPGSRASQSDKTKRSWADPEIRERRVQALRESLKRYWSNPTNKIAWLAARRKNS